VLLEHFKPARALTEKEADAIRAVKTMLDGVADVKRRHSRKIPLRP
jgi:hypothetical protein